MGILGQERLRIEYCIDKVLKKRYIKYIADVYVLGLYYYSSAT